MTETDFRERLRTFISGAQRRQTSVQMMYGDSILKRLE